MANLEARLKGKNPPKKLQGVLWSSPVNRLDLWEHEAYIVHQVLAFGTWSEWQWLFDTYTREEIKRTFIEEPAKEYTRPAFNFVKNILLQLKSPSPPPNKYVKDLPRDISP